MLIIRPRSDDISIPAKGFQYGHSTRPMCTISQNLRAEHQHTHTTARHQRRHTQPLTGAHSRLAQSAIGRRDAQIRRPRVYPSRLSPRTVRASVHLCVVVFFICFVTCPVLPQHPHHCTREPSSSQSSVCVLGLSYTEHNNMFPSGRHSVSAIQ